MLVLPATNPNGSDLNARSAARQIRLDRICTAKGLPVGRNPWMGGVTAKGRKPEVTLESSVFKSQDYYSVQQCKSAWFMAML